MSKPYILETKVDPGNEQTVSHGDAPPLRRCPECGKFHEMPPDLLPELEALVEPLSEVLAALEERLDAEDAEDDEDDEDDFDEDDLDEDEEEGEEEEDEGVPRPRAELEAELDLARRLLVASQGSLEQVERLEDEVEGSILGWLSDLGFELGRSGMIEEGVALCRSVASTLKKLDFAGDAAQILAIAGRKEEARAAVEALLAEAPEHGDALEAAAEVFEVCGLLERAERCNRRILELTSPEAEPELVGRTVLRLSDLLRSLGREGEAAVLEEVYERFLEEEDDDLRAPPIQRPVVPAPEPEGRMLSKGEETYQRPEPKVGRNAPCPCGSGKKYKKCCGA